MQKLTGYLGSPALSDVAESEAPKNLGQAGCNAMAMMVAVQLGAMGVSMEEKARFLTEEPGPEPDVCPHCGRKLPYPKLLGPNDMFLAYQPIPEECTTPECVEIARQETAAEEERKRMEEVVKALRESGIAVAHQKCTLEAYRPQNATSNRALRIAERYVVAYDNLRKDGHGLYITGPYGTGKTHLAVGIAQALIRAGRRFITFAPATEIIAGIKNGFDSAGLDMMARCKNASLLIIDDIGKEYQTQWAVAQLAELIDYRCSVHRPTIYTSNHAMDELEKSMAKSGAGDSAGAIASRIAGSCTVIEVAGEDWRRKA